MEGLDQLMQFIKTNWTHVAPILLSAAFALAISIERFMALYFVYPMGRSLSFFERVRELVLMGKMQEAVGLCDRYRSKMVSNILKEAVIRAHQPEHMVEQGVALAISVESEKLTKRTSFLATIANVSTLLGLLGTIAGLIHSFAALQKVDAQQKSAMLAAGISTAMNATMLGLGVAVPCMVIFSFLIARSNKLNSELEQAGLRALDMVSQRQFAVENEGASAAGGNAGGFAGTAVRRGA